MADRLQVVLCCHAHLPDCRDLVTGEFKQPWVYLRTIGEYAELAGYLEATLEARAVVCISPIVLEQIADYRHQLEEWLRDGHRIGDPVLGLFGLDCYPRSHEDRAAVCGALLREFPRHRVERFPECTALLDLLDRFSGRALDYRWLSDECIGDLLVWLHLAWLTPHAESDDLRIELLKKKRTGFSGAERRVVVEAIADLLAGVSRRYRSLHERGRIELAAGLYTCPSVHLLYGADPPTQPSVPDEEKGLGASAEHRLERQLDAGLAEFEAFFGLAPLGCVVIDDEPTSAFDDLLASRGIDWVATRASGLSPSAPALDDARLTRYRLAPADASDEGVTASEVIAALESTAMRLENPAGSVVPVAFSCSQRPLQSQASLASFFELCSRVSDHPALELSTFSRALRNNSQPCYPDAMEEASGAQRHDGQAGPYLQMLTDARDAYVEMVGSFLLPAHRVEVATRQLMVCEDSAWLGGMQAPGNGITRLGRMHMCNLYRILGMPIPAGLANGATSTD